MCWLAWYYLSLFILVLSVLSFFASFWIISITGSLILSPEWCLFSNIYFFSHHIHILWTHGPHLQYLFWYPFLLLSSFLSLMTLFRLNFLLIITIAKIFFLVWMPVKFCLDAGILNFILLNIGFCYVPLKSFRLCSVTELFEISLIFFEAFL